MTLPGWVLSKTFLVGVGVSVAVGAGGLWWNAHNAKVRRVAVAEERTRVLEEMEERQKVIVEAWQDSLDTERARNDALISQATPVIGTYTRERERVASTPQPSGLPAGMVVVPESYVAAADSAVRQIPILIAMVQREREIADLRVAAADSMVTLLAARNAQLEILVREAGPSLKDKGMYAAIGGAAAYVLFKVLEK